MGCLEGRLSNMKLFYTLTASLMIHILIWILSQIDPIKAPHKAPIEVTYLDQKKSVVQQTSLPDRLKNSVDKLKKKARFLSLKKQRVHQETVARNVGETANQLVNRPKKSRPAPSQTRGFGKSKNKVPKPPGPGQIYGGNPGFKSPSAIAEHIPNVREGNFTSLNQDQFIYYSFYSRINHRIKHRWISGVNKFVREANYRKLKGAARRSQLTQIEVLLNEKGDYIKTIVHRKSDYPELDQAAIRAFIESAPHLNPPEEMVKKDGFIHLHYSLYVMFAPNFIASRKKK